MQTNLFGETAIDLSIRIMREFEPPEGYYLAFSGGKDSTALRAVADIAGVRYDAHYSVTTIDPPELVRFIKEQHPDVCFDKPTRSFYAFIREHYGLPMRHARWCCEELKERGGEGRVVLTGVRAAESNKRARYGIVRPCLRGGGKTLINPLLHWSTADVWDFIREQGLPYCSLYDEGFARLGCVFCPFERNIARARAMWPKMFARLEAAVRDAYPGQASWQKYGSPEAVLDWWYDRIRPQVDGDEQQVFSFDQFEDAEQEAAQCRL
jgi:phosphoadenosine phosphosulfate reductase